MSEFSSKWIQVSEPIPHVFHVQLAWKPVNAFTRAYFKEYGKLFDRITEDAKDVRAVVVSSSLPKTFTAGIDVTDFREVLRPDTSEDPARTAQALRKFLLESQFAITAPSRCPFPVIAAVHGLVMGLGVDMISACDIRYAASNSTFTIKEVDIGLAPDMGTLAFLPKITGNQSLVRELAYTSRLFSAEEGEKIGLLSKVVGGSKDEVVNAALDLAKVIAQKSPVAITGSKQLISHARDHTVAQNLEYTATWNGGALQTHDIKEFFAATEAKRAPNFTPLHKVFPKL